MPIEQRRNAWGRQAKVVGDIRMIPGDVDWLKVHPSPWVHGAQQRKRDPTANAKCTQVNRSSHALAVPRRRDHRELRTRLERKLEKNA